MSRVRLAPLLGLAMALAAGCGGKSSAPSRGNFRLPSSVAFFSGVTTQDAQHILPYFAVANEGRDDLSLVDAQTDVVLNAPILLRPLAIPFPGRPAQLASASFGDGGADLLVGVAAGDSKLQLVQTWSPANAVDADAVTGQAVDLGADVLGIVAFPPGTTPTTPAPTARLAVALAGRKLAIVQYARAADGSVVKDTTYGTGGVLVGDLGFEVADITIAVASDGTPHLYAATLDPIGPGAVRGVADVNISAPAPWPLRALDARAPTRLVAAAALAGERLPGSIANEATAFAGQPTVRRIYAVLDEASCGIGHRIDCGLVTLDPDKTPAAGDDNIPEDWAGWMPYRAPIQLRARPLAIAVSGPPARDPTDATYPPGQGFMRLVLGSYATVATTAVGMAAEENGTIEFLDLGRFKVASTTSAPISASTSATPPKATDRLWIQDPATLTFPTNDVVSSFIHVTPGYAQDEVWTVAYQGVLPDLANRAAEAGYYASGQPWLAVQFGDGTPGTSPRLLSQVARLYHPALGVRVGDIVVIKADSLLRAGVTGCVGLPPPGTAPDLVNTVPWEFDTVVTQLLPPSDATPGGAVVLGPRTKGSRELNPLDPTDVASPPAWQACWTALTNALNTPGSSLKSLIVTFFAGDNPDPAGPADLLLTGSVLGYAGRPRVGTEYVLQYKADPSQTGLQTWAYQDEDALAASCPLADWDGSWPAPASVLTCGGAGCDRALCEQLVLARKVRRRYHVAEDCGTDAGCQGRYPPATYTFPGVNGPALRFQVGYDGAPNVAWIRGSMALLLGTTSGVAPLSVSAGGATSNASGAMAFDRSPYPDLQNAGYRFLVTYPGNQIADVSPSVTPVSSNTIR